MGRDKKQVLLGFRLLYGEPVAPSSAGPLLRQGAAVEAERRTTGAWRVIQGSSSVAVTLSESRVAATVEVAARLKVQAVRDAATVVLAVPFVEPHPLDGGGADFAVDWQLAEVVDEAGTAVDVRVPALAADARAAWSEDRRLVFVRWPEAVPGGATRTLRVVWRQEVPYGAVDGLFSRAVRMGTSTPAVPVFPTVLGDDGRFPFGLRVTAPEGTVVAASGRERPGSGEGSEVRRDGDAGGAAVVIVAPRFASSRPGVRLLTADPLPWTPDRLDSLSPRLWTWADRRLAHVDVVELVRGWRFPAAIWGADVVGLRLATRLERPIGGLRAPTLPDLPELQSVLVAEGVAGAAWAAGVGSDAEGQAWVRSLARAFALDQIDPYAALSWRDYLQDCVTTPGRPALSPYAAARTGYRDLSERCAGPLLLGPMLVDRLGAEGARSVRSRLLAGKRLDAHAVVEAVREVAPDAVPWAEAWLLGGHVPRLAGAMRTRQDGERWAVDGTLSADVPLAGAPVTVRLSGPLRCADVRVAPLGSEGTFRVELPFRPGRIEVDPDHRLLRRDEAVVADDAQRLRSCVAVPTVP